VNAKQLSVIQKNLRDFTNQNVLNPFCENSSLTIQQIIYDKDVSQYFNPSVFNTNFEHLEYLLPSLDALDIPLTPIIERNIISQFPKCIKRWHGKVLVDNLLVLDKFKVTFIQTIDF